MDTSSLLDLFDTLDFLDLFDTLEFLDFLVVPHWSSIKYTFVV